MVAASGIQLPRLACREPAGDGGRHRPAQRRLRDSHLGPSVAGRTPIRDRRPGMLLMLLTFPHLTHSHPPDSGFLSCLSARSKRRSFLRTSAATCGTTPFIPELRVGPRTRLGRDGSGAPAFPTARNFAGRRRAGPAQPSPALPAPHGRASPSPPVTAGPPCASPTPCVPPSLLPSPFPPPAQAGCARHRHPPAGALRGAVRWGGHPAAPTRPGPGGSAETKFAAAAAVPVQRGAGRAGGGLGACLVRG
ncbi:uncharacterized protein [Anomalospiza imberbis]|uniref:uncharacterized protein n=1 Tax=Anomalospiza imberbis TaxID=187417 RepID=UPI00358EC74C